MNRILFLGNSHLSAIKLAYDDSDQNRMPRCSFFCARGADLAFTSVIDGKIVPTTTSHFGDDDTEAYFINISHKKLRRYKDAREPLVDVAYQFAVTGGSEEIRLSNVSAIFYVLGLSPYDFVRLGDYYAPISRTLRQELMKKLLCSNFLLRRQVEDIKSFNPYCKHFFIGTPISAANPTMPSPLERAIVSENRRIVRSLANNYLFDDVFMPPDHLLTESLLETKLAYSVGGRNESASFQGIQSHKPDDLSHMNKAYGLEVFRKFIEPLVAPISA